MSEARPLLRDALLVVAIGALLLLALEGGARLLGLGLPEAPEIPDKPPGAFRILTVGGSTVLGVPDGSQGFVAQLERGLRRSAPSRPLEVLNLARSGIDSAAVRATLAPALDAGPDLLIVLIGHNEFLAPPPGRLQRLRDASRLARLVSAPFTSEAAVEVPFPELTPVNREGAAFRRATERFRQNLDGIVALARGAGVPLLLCTAPANLADWPPAERQLVWPNDRSETDAAIAAVRALLAQGDAAAAASAAGEGLAAAPDDAMLLYLEGRALRQLGRAEAARERFARARDLDPVPRRAFGQFNDAVRSHAASPGVHLVDVARELEEHAELGLVGFELVCDNCHPTPLGNAIIARALARTMAEADLFLARGTAIAPREHWQAQLGVGSDETQRRSRLRWLLSNAIYAMKTPFFHYEASRAYLEQARVLAPNDWRVVANLASLDLLEGDLVAGRRGLRRAATLHGAPLDPDDRSVTPYLKEALARLPAPGAGGS